MIEHRRHNRYAVEELDIHGKILWTTEVKIHNISLGGAQVSLNRRLNIGSEYILKLMYKDDEMVPIKGVVVREELSGSMKNERGEVVPIYMAGIEFKDVVTGKGSELIAFIERISNTPSLRLKGVRVKLHIPKKVLMDFPQTYSVRKISQSGMLIEFQEELPLESKIPMEIIFPDNSNQVMFLGRIVSCALVPGKTPKHYDIGVEFIEISEGDRAKIEKFLKALPKSKQ
jgi:c-di-GMP-binding flagellar brake protein YcgR